MSGELATVSAIKQPAQLMQSIEKYLESMGNKLSQKHRTQFIEIASAFQLNPFIREIYGIPYGDNFNIIVGYEVYLKRAETSGQLAGWRAWTEGEGANIKGCVEITRRDWSAPFYHEVYLEEYDQRNSMWKSKPRTMIKKVAIAQGFRMAFPVELGGIPYTADELPIPEQSQRQAEYQQPRQQRHHEDQPVDTEIVASLQSCNSLEELQAAWLEIPVSNRRLYSGVKDEVKARLVNPAQEAENAAA